MPSKRPGSCSDTSADRARSSGPCRIGATALTGEGAVRVRAGCRCGLLVCRWSVAGDRDAGLLDHQQLRGLQRDRAVQHAARNRERRAGSQLHRVATLEFNAQPAADDVEELVLVLVLVPVIFAAREDAQAKQDAADLDQGLVVPGMVRPLDRLGYVDELQRAEQRLVIDLVASLLRHAPTLRTRQVGGGSPIVRG